MRIIAGQFGGRTLLPPPSDKTRPITDRAKQSLFDNLVGYLENAVVLDCFAGTGSMGLESLSRGARRAIFVERDRGALRNLRQNIQDLGLEPLSLVLPIDAYASAEHPEISNPEAPKLDLAFLDPPYAHMETGHHRHKMDLLVTSLAAHALTPTGLIILRHPSRVSVDAAGMGVQIALELKYGDMAITWLRKTNS